MHISGTHFIGKTAINTGSGKFQAINPQTGESLSPSFPEATEALVDQAVQKANEAFAAYRKTSPEQRAQFLEAIGDEIMALGDTLIQRVMQEAGLPEGRFIGERGRTVNQMKLFAQVVREGSWVEARIDKADPDRKPFPKPDIRYMQIAIGPVAVFGASNFPLAFSVAGGDTASALAAGCPVVVKGHPAHPGTSEMIAHAILSAAKKTGMPDGVFSLVHGASYEAGMALVRHPLIKAVGFTGSLRGGKALFDAAMARPEPIPVYAEMGSTNPVFILPEAMKNRGQGIAEGLASSVTLGVGQFCTNPGMVIGLDNQDTQAFMRKTGESLAGIQPGTMLTPGILAGYQKGIEKMAGSEGVEMIAEGESTNTFAGAKSYAFKTHAENLNRDLSEEIFGPSTLLITAKDKNQMLQFASELEGHLTATIHGETEELGEYQDLIDILEQKVGRVLINGFPTGVEVCHSMVHGGPYPATTDPRSTSVGTAAIKRFARPVCYQNFPQSLLPDALKETNPLGLWRLVNGEYQK